jgi:hypothetical protein
MIYKNYTIEPHDSLLGWYAAIINQETGVQVTTDLYRIERTEPIEDAKRLIDSLPEGSQIDTEQTRGQLRGKTQHGDEKSHGNSYNLLLLSGLVEFLLSRFLPVLKAGILGRLNPPKLTAFHGHSFGSLSRMGDREKGLIIRHWDDMLRLAGSLKMGTVQAASIMRTLRVGDRPTKLAQAVAELGRIDKTIHILTSIDDETKRRRTLIQLNRGEDRHRLARAIFHGKRGELR